MKTLAAFFWFLVASLCPALLAMAAPGALPLPPRPDWRIAYVMSGVGLFGLTNGPARVKTRAAPPPAVYNLPPFIYPPDMTNYEWTLEFSTNLCDWQIIGPAFAPGPAAGTVTVPTPGAYGFYRMHGVLNPVAFTP